MKFPDRPIATAGLGIACALILLGILSYPAFIGSASTATEVATQTLTGSSTQSSALYVAVATTTESSVSSSSLSSLVSTATVLQTVNSLTTMISSPTAAQSSTTSIGKTVPDNATAVQGGTTLTASKCCVSITAGGTTLTQITTIASSSPPIAVSSSQSQPGQFTNAGSLSASTNTSHFLDLIVELSLVSLIIAAGSMLFISRRLNSEKDAEV